MAVALYRHYDVKNKLLYIGISICVLIRLKQHKERSHWSDSIAKVTIEYYDTRALAEAAEKTAIIKEKPIHNIVHNNPKEKQKPQIDFKEFKNMLSCDADKHAYLWKIEEESKLFSVVQTAHRLHITENLVRKFIKEKKLECFFVGKKAFVTGKQLNAFTCYVYELNKKQEKEDEQFYQQQKRIEKFKDLWNTVDRFSIWRKARHSRKRNKV